MLDPLFHHCRIHPVQGSRGTCQWFAQSWHWAGLRPCCLGGSFHRQGSQWHTPLWLAGLKDICTSAEKFVSMDTSASNTSEPVFQLRSLPCLAQAEHFHKDKSIAGGICRTVCNAQAWEMKVQSNYGNSPNCFILQKNTNEENLAWWSKEERWGERKVLLIWLKFTSSL